MSYYLDTDTNSYNYVRSGITISNTHGANLQTALRHLKDMEDVANSITDKKINAFSKDLEHKIELTINDKIEQSVLSYLRGLKYDCEVVAEVLLQNGQSIWNKREITQVISDNIYKQMKEQLNKTFTIK